MVYDKSDEREKKKKNKHDHVRQLEWKKQANESGLGNLSAKLNFNHKYYTQTVKRKHIFNSQSYYSLAPRT